MARSRRRHCPQEKQAVVGGESYYGKDHHNSALVPQSKKKTKSVMSKPMSKKLTKKERKRLEQIVDRKNKKASRRKLLEDLAKVQVEPSELAMFDSIAHLGTKNSRISSLSKRPLSNELQYAIQETPISLTNNLKGWTGHRKRRKLQKKEKIVEIVQEENSSDSTSSSEDDEVEADSQNTVQDDHPENISEQEISSETGDIKVEENKILDGEEQDNVKVKVDKVEKKIEEEPIKPATYIHVNRDPDIQEARLQLPILAEEQAVMEAIAENSIVIICGQTGSGKTTQVPQFLYEAGYAESGMIGVTEPRRVAAVSMSKRVAKEMNLSTSKISYQIRYENNITDETCIKFMTDGVLTREMKKDILLSKYSVIILDEAHERTTNTDVLIGLLSRIVPLRNKKGKPLKLIIMSATLRIEDFTENKRLYKTPPPVIKIDARQYSVTIHFNKKTPVSDDPRTCPYLNEAYKKVCKIHRTLPPGGILVFVTGRQEVNALKKKFNLTFPSKPLPESEKNSDTDERLIQVSLDNYKPDPSIDDHDMDDDVTDERDAILNDDEEGNSDEEIFMDDSAYTSESDKEIPLYVLPLYALLSPEKQRQVFDPVPEHCRLCVVATNVAETSLTIPGIKYIVDTGKVKKKLYDKVTGVSTFRVTWISKASADQRAGRAGRTDSGHAYRLYSSAVFQDFLEHDEPEISSKPVAGLVLQMKSMKITRVVNFPFPTSPSPEALESAEKLLVSLGALKVKPCTGSLKEMKQAQYTGTITNLGNLISSFPVHPRFGKMIAEATRYGDAIISFIIIIVSALTVKEIFFTASHDPDNNSNKEQSRQLTARLQHMKSLWSAAGGGPERRLLGDLMVMLGAVGSAEYSKSFTAFCTSNCLRIKALIEIRKLRQQLTNIIKCVMNNENLCVDPKMKPPSDEQVYLLRQIILSAMGDQVARKLHSSEIPEELRNKMKGAYRSLLIEESVFIHPDSVMSQDPLPDYVVFHEIIETEKRIYMRDVFSIEPGWLGVHCPNFCVFSKPLDEPSPRYDAASDDVMCNVTAHYGRLSWPLGLVEISYPPCLQRYRWFAVFLMEGKVIESLQNLTPLLLMKPIVMVKTWAKLQPKTEIFLRDLLDREVDSKAKLLQIWKEDSSYLRSTFMEWLPTSLHNKLDHWPPT